MGKPAEREIHEIRNLLQMLVGRIELDDKKSAYLLINRVNLKLIEIEIVLKALVH